MSPSGTSAESTRSTMRVSPGQTVGSMLHPVTCNRSVPDDRNTSAASSHFIACDSLTLMLQALMSSLDCCYNSETSPGSFHTKAPLSQTPSQIETKVSHKASFASRECSVRPIEYDCYPLEIPVVIVSLPGTPAPRRRHCRPKWCKFDCLE